MANPPNTNSGSDPIGNNIKATHDTSSGQAGPALEIDHVYFQQAVLVDGGAYNHVVTGVITLKNNSSTVTLSDISVYIQLDTSANVHGPYFCDQNGNTQQQQAWMTMTFPDIVPGSNSPSQPYYWTLWHHGNLQEPGAFTVTPKLSPEYTVSYQTAPPFGQNDSTTVLLKQP